MSQNSHNEEPPQVPSLNSSASASHSETQRPMDKSKHHYSKGAIKKKREPNRNSFNHYVHKNLKNETALGHDNFTDYVGPDSRKMTRRNNYSQEYVNRTNYSHKNTNNYNGYRQNHNFEYNLQNQYFHNNFNNKSYTSKNSYNCRDSGVNLTTSNGEINLKNNQINSAKHYGGNYVPSRQNQYREKNSHYESNYFQKNHRYKNYNKPTKKKNYKEVFPKKVDVANQRDRLEEMLLRRSLECLVCCEMLKHSDKVWTCQQCYHILHLKCVQAWANSSKLELGWRCPACQNVCKEIPTKYFCFCGKLSDPKPEPGLTPHSCGETCLKRTRQCDHACMIMCHPGPCPECVTMVAKPCGCGKTSQQVKCSSETEIVCREVCGKVLTCLIHKCEEKCHPGECSPCNKVLRQECHCFKEGRKVSCNAEHQGKTSYSCQNVCDKILSCENHHCKDICHVGKCSVCVSDVSAIKSCFCGKTPLKISRTSCLEPIPTCDKVCGKILKCGQPNNPHICKSKCHGGECPPCPLTTILKCRCGSMNKEVACGLITTKADDARCEKKCTKKRLCGKHKCNQKCCIEIEHVCPLPCNQRLTCGKHRCERTCHSGRCPTCIETSFDELYCECGASVMYPPVPCGTKPPSCNQPCVRDRECGHESNHNCHTGPCPPCTILCKRWCYGKHELRSAVPCHQDDFSCGLPCGKPMQCGRHKCSKPCHLKDCPIPCRQPCSTARLLCGHPCNAPCHESPCPETNCKGKVAVSCVCGVQKGFRQCSEMTDEFKNIQIAILSEKMSSLTKDQTVDIRDVGQIKRPDVLKILDCTDECRIIERNRRLAIGLQIRNPDLSQKLTPRYSDFMRSWAKKDPTFCQKVHDRLNELVQLAKQSKQKSRSYSFESMNRDKRQFVHEYCEHFGCESAAYDMEPNRNIVATAIKDKSWLPSMSLMEVIQRENGQRKVPGPLGLNRNFNVKLESPGFRPLGKSVQSAERTVKN